MGGYTPDIQWTDIVRRTGHESAVQRDPLDEPEALGLSVEWIDTVGVDRKYVCLFQKAESALLMRREIRLKRVADQARSIPAWEGDLPISPRLVHWEMRSLEKWGLWDLEDSRSGIEVLDGEWFVVRARDPVRNRYRDACLFCPDMSENRSVRKLGSRVAGMVGMGQRAFRLRSRLCALLPFF